MTDKTLYRFGRCEVDSSTRQVRVDGHPSAIEPRPFDLLVHLIRHRRRVVTKEELRETVWPRETVSDAALARAVMKARKAIGDGGSEPSQIRSLPRVGYRFVAALDQETAALAVAASPQRAADVLTIALLPFENATGDDSLGWLELGLMAVVANALGNHPKFAPVAMQSLLIAVGGARSDPAGRLDDMVRQTTGAKAVVRSRVSQVRTGFRLDFELCGAVPDPGDAVFAEKPAELGARMVAALGEKLFPDVAMPDPKGLVLRDPLATESFARGMEALATHQWVKAINLFRLAADLDPGHMPARLELLRALGNTGDLEALRLSRRLLARAERENDLQLAARVNQALGRLYLNRNEMPRAEFHLEASLRLAAGQQPADWIARTLMLQASAALSQVDYPRASETVHQMHRQCQISGDRVLPVAGLNIEAIIASASGDRELAVRLSMEALRRARELRAHMYICDACDNAARYLAALGRLDEAASCAEEGFAVLQAIGDQHNLPPAVSSLCWIYLLARAPMAAERVVAALAEQEEAQRTEHTWLSLGLLASCRGHHAEAAAGLRRAIDRLREGHAVQLEQQTLPWLIDALVLSGARAEAETELEIAASPRLAGSPDLAAQVLHGRALLAHARGHAGEASTLLTLVIDSRPAPLWLAWACIDSAWLLAEAGQADAAARQLEKLPASMAGHPIALAVSARVRLAGGDTAGALAAQQASLKALGTHAHAYWLQLEEKYKAASATDLTPAHFPPAPLLPSRL